MSLVQMLRKHYGIVRANLNTFFRNYYQSAPIGYRKDDYFKNICYLNKQKGAQNLLVFSKPIDQEVGDENKKRKFLYH